MPALASMCAADSDVVGTCGLGQLAGGQGAGVVSHAGRAAALPCRVCGRRPAQAATRRVQAYDRGRSAGEGRWVGASCMLQVHGMHGWPYGVCCAGWSVRVDTVRTSVPPPDTLASSRAHATVASVNALSKALSPSVRNVATCVLCALTAMCADRVTRYLCMCADCG